MVYLPLLWSVLVTLSGPRLVGALPAKWAAPGLVTTGLLTAFTFQLSCVVLVAVTVREYLAQPGGAERSGSRPLSSAVLFLIAATLLIAGAARAILLIVQHARDGRRVDRLTAATNSPILVLHDDHARAYATAGIFQPGVIVTTTGLLGALTPRERATVFAHEQAHLQHRHHLLIALASLAAALDPMLPTLIREVRYACERDADETAVLTVGDRGFVARTVAHAALLTTGQPYPRAALGIARSLVAARVSALIAPPTRPSSVAVIGVLALVLSASLGAADAAHDASGLLPLLGWS
jgi:beta-lactamase regulating signal transducer with metallopeptidase domain